MANLTEFEDRDNFINRKRQQRKQRALPMLTETHDELSRLAEEIGVSPKASNNGCFLFGAGLSVLAIGAAVLAVFGSGNVKLRREPLCCCLEHIGDNGPCPVHGDPFGKKEGKS